jgi:tRNA nucleotidyltransferase/poly(A) polymerase
MKIDWKIFKSSMVKFGISLMKDINNYGYESYIVGGAVRDIVMDDLDIHDIDIATNMPIDQIKKHFKTYDMGGEKHGTCIVHYNNFDYELTQFRTESTYSDNRHPDEVKYINSFEEDTKRRDFTINSMGIDAEGNVIDYHKGIDDIKNKKLKAVGDPYERFGEDSLRIIRALRFASRFGLDIDKNTFNAIVKMKKSLSNLAIERIIAELRKTAEYGATKFVKLCEILDITGIGDEILPFNIDWKNVINSLKEHATQPLISSLDKDYIVVFSILLNNVSNLKNVCKTLKLSNNDTESIIFIKKHLYDYAYLAFGDPVDSYELVINKDFNRLREVYHSIHGEDINDANIRINKYKNLNEAHSRLSELSKAVSEQGLFGKEFGETLKKLKIWFFNEYIKSNKPTEDDITKYLKTIKK